MSYTHTVTVPKINRPAQALFAVAFAFATGWSSAALAQRGLSEPETSTGITAKSLATASRHMISTAHPLATEAGREILRQGGSAVDAAIAAELVLGLVEPQSSGLGGGAFLVHWQKSSRVLSTYDGRETAPHAATSSRFLKDGKPVPFETAVKSGLSIGTPGLVRLLEHVHGKHGKLAWARLFEPAIRLADEGFPVSRRLSYMLTWHGAASFDEPARRYFFYEAGQARGTGETLKNPEYAATLRAIAAGGAEVFYSGAIAQAVVAAARAAPRFAGDLALSDLAGYRSVERAAQCFSYRKRRVCGMGPPSSGTIAVGQIFGIIEPLELMKPGETAISPRAMHAIAEAEKLAYADRARYLADPAFVAVPSGLLDQTYIAERRALIDLERAMAKPEPGQPPGLQRRTFGIDATRERAGTTHLSVIDGDGNAVAMTATIEGAFGSGVWAAGFLLNNELTDFSFRPADDTGTPIANRVEPGKRPRSTMTPLIVLGADGEVEAVLGSPGGSRIIYYVTKTLVAMIDGGMDPQSAAGLLNFGSQGGPFEIEMAVGGIVPMLRMKSYGHAINVDLLNSGVHVVARRNGRLEGGADPRRDGIALGD